MPLTDTQIRNLKPCVRAAKFSDRGGLHLLVTDGGSKLWRLAYRFGGKQKTLALGIYPHVSLADARSKRDSAKVRRPCWRPELTPLDMPKMSGHALAPLARIPLML